MITRIFIKSYIPTMVAAKRPHITPLPVAQSLRAAMACRTIQAIEVACSGSIKGYSRPRRALPDAVVIVGHLRRYSPRATHNHENNGKGTGANTGITVGHAAVRVPIASMTHDHRRPPRLGHQGPRSRRNAHSAGNGQVPLREASRPRSGTRLTAHLS
jgi:hypothetical protein